uniref:2-dehydropantoate 2-reductase (Ketopantoate reductase) (KPA reductase) (KPR) n=1 Tax=mine drainage metagenome TaxID=410659 RepID=E6PRL0_9ZZZZ
MKVCIFGAGAIGGLIGGQLARAGADVSFVARGAHLQAMQTNGLRLRIDGQEHVVRVPCTSNPAELGPQDYVFITLKAHSVPGAVESMHPLLGQDTAVVTGVNGLPYWYFHQHGGPYAGTVLNSVDPGGLQWNILGPERGIGCVLYPAADLIAPGVIQHAYGKKFPIGEPSGQSTERIARLHEVMTAAGFDAPVRNDIRDEIWLKLWGNLCLNPISALTHATLDVITTDPATRALARGMMLEAQALAELLGVRFRVGIERRLDGAGAIVGHKTSMLQDLEQGRPMEIDPLLGVIQEIGRLVGRPTPLADAVLALIKLREKMVLLRQ